MEAEERVSIFINVDIITLNYHIPKAEAIAFSKGKIIGLGSNAEIIEKYPGALVNDANGATMVPGFIDNHVHLLQTGYSKIYLELEECETWEQILFLVKQKVNTISNETKMVKGYNYDDHLFEGDQIPNRWDLDEVSEDCMVWLNRVDFHSAIVNTKMLKELSLPEDLKGIVKNKFGEPTGVLRAEAYEVSRKFINKTITEEENKKAMEAATYLASSEGVTTVAVLEGDDKYGQDDIEFLIKYRDKSQVNLVLFYQTFDVDKVIKMGLPRIGGCLLLDGSIGSWTAALSESYSDKDYKGNLYNNQEFINEFVLKAHRKGFQIAMHAIGDRAIGQALEAYQNAITKYPKVDHRHRIEHFELPNDDHIELAKELGIVLSVQPSFEYYWGGEDNLYGVRLGKKRVKKTNPFRQIIDKNILLAGGSDAAVTTMCPLLGMYSAVNHPNSEQRIDVNSALKMFTINGAYALGVEKTKGSIEVGKDADFVILDKSPLSVEKEKINQIKVEKTIVKGEIIYNRSFNQKQIV